MYVRQTKKRWSWRLPHWEMEGHWHFITIRCRDSLPKEAKRKIEEIHRSIEKVNPQTEDFAYLQRRYFLTVEKYLDTGSDFAPFKESQSCQSCLKAFAEIELEGWSVGEATIMPNHVHFMILRNNSPFSLKQIVERFKGRSSRWINQAMGYSGRFWQEDWFDRWMRDDTERAKTVEYIRNNPVKAKLVND